MKAENKRVFIWSTGIDDILDGKDNVTGITLQLSYWARTFIARGWKVSCLTGKPDSCTKYGIDFISLGKSRFLSKIHLSILHNIHSYSVALRKAHPDYLIMRGSSRDLFLLSILCKFNRIKLVFFGASDKDFISGEEYVARRGLDAKRYHLGVKNTELFITQNEEQAALLQKYYHKTSLVIPNISLLPLTNNVDKRYDAIWVSNMWPIKRTEWFIRLAASNPNYSFAIVGGAISEPYYCKMKESAENVINLTFFGSQKFDAVTSLISESKVLVCTSEFEGFPNTFIQAWSQTVPVISTVNPSHVITKYNIGKIVKNEEELNEVFGEVMSDATDYSRMKDNISAYYEKEHSADSGLDRLLTYVRK